MSKSANKVISYIFFFCSTVLTVLAAVSFVKINSLYASIPEETKKLTEMQNISLGPIFNAFSLASFFSFFLAGLIFFGFGVIILNQSKSAN